MRHLRSDYDAIQPWPVKRPHTAKVYGTVSTNIAGDIPDDGTVEPLIPDDEPVFLLRGQDPLAAPLVRLYATHLANEGGDPELVEALHGWATEMQHWAEEAQHGLPDVPDSMLRAVAQGAGHLSVADARRGFDGK